MTYMTLLTIRDALRNEIARMERLDLEHSVDHFQQALTGVVDHFQQALDEIEAAIAEAEGTQP